MEELKHFQTHIESSSHTEDSQNIYFFFVLLIPFRDGEKSVYCKSDKECIKIMVKILHVFYKLSCLCFLIFNLYLPWSQVLTEWEGSSKDDI